MKEIEMARPTFKSFKAEALKRKGVREAYTELAPAYEVRKKLIAIKYFSKAVHPYGLC